MYAPPMRFAFMALLALPLLVACATPADEHYSFTPPDTPGGRLCLSQCIQAQSYCGQGCSLEKRQCAAKVDEQAITDYDRYTRMQFAAGEAVELRPRDFERTAPCDIDQKNCTGDCDKNYRMCYETCGGKVDTVSSCQFLCF
jgi:hypothetical protein